MSTDNETPPSSRTIKASEFKAKCLKLMDEVAESGEEIIITKNGKPVAKLTAYKPAAEEPSWKKPGSMFGIDRGKIQILGDLDDAFLDVDERPETLFGIDRGRLQIVGDIDGALSDVEWEAISNPDRVLNPC